MPRLLFEKRGQAVWISHLDLMRLFQRAFKRAGLPLKHTQGFNPRPFVSIALPLSVGIESTCELLDFELDGESVPNETILSGLNRCLIDGICVLSVYDEMRKIKDLSLLDCKLVLEYDSETDDRIVPRIEELFKSEHLILEKKSKNGITDQDIIPMIRSVRAESMNRHEVQLYARICCQNPSLNPMQLYAAIVKYLPEYTPDCVSCSRVEIYDSQENVFR